MARGGGGAGSAPPSRDVQVSKKISWLLRHGAEKEGFTLGPGGYVNVKDVVSPLISDESSSTFLTSSSNFMLVLEHSSLPKKEKRLFTV